VAQVAALLHMDGDDDAIVLQYVDLKKMEISNRKLKGRK